MLLALSTVGAGAAVAADAPAPPLAALAVTATITSPSAGSFQNSNSFTVSGTKDAGSTVAVTATPTGGNATTVCPATTATGDALGWSCTASGVPNGKTVTLTAVETPISDSSTSAASVTVNVLGAPSLDGAGSFVTPGIVSGGAITGNVVTVTLTNPSGVGCSSGVVNGYWSCSIRAPSGTYTVTAHQSWSSGDPNYSEESASQRVTVDKDRPVPPVVLTPRANSRAATQPVTFSGTGEARGFLNVYVDASPVCGASVDTSGRWRCAASGIKDGAHAVQAIQSDFAGNFSDPSAPLKVFFGPKPAAPVVPPTSATPESPSPSPSPTPEPTPSAPPIPYVPGSGAPPPTLQEALTNWGTPTSFGTQLPTLAQTVAGGNWLLAPLLALGFLLLIALPLRLIASTLRGRLHLPRAQFTGRNRGAPEPDDSPPTNPWLAGAVPLAAAAGLIVLTVGINGEVRFLRLLAAVGIGLVLLNVVGVAIATRVTGRLQSVSGRLRFLPTLLFAAAATALFSRLAGIDPPVVVGVLIGVGFARSIPVRTRGIANLTEVGVLVLLAMIGWFARQSLRPLEGFWGNLLLETLATLCLAGLGSAVMLMLPLGRLPGRVLLEWSPVVWAVSTAVVATLAWAIALGGTAVNFPVLGAFLVAAGFTVLSVAVWTWVRYVEPAEA
ncbi:MAG: hypothetical protein ABIY53_00580 [Lacisediminihabitans sp.]